MPHLETILVEEDMEGERLDTVVSDQVESLSRSLVKSLVEEGKVLVDGQLRKPSYHVKEGERIEIEVPAAREIKLIPRDIPLDIIYQDQDLAVIDKPKGLVVHPAQGNWDYTLVNALLFHIKDLSGINGELRPGIVHRLDKDTSGLMVVAKNDNAHRGLAEQIKVHGIHREYTALVHGVIAESQGRIEAPIGRSKTDRKKMAVVADGREAVSIYQVLDRLGNYSLVRVQLQTGRTHQIRVHFAYIKHPVVGDPVYGPARRHLGLESQALHASRLGFEHPRSGEYLEFASPLPEYFIRVLDTLRKTH